MYANTVFIVFLAARKTAIAVWAKTAQIGTLVGGWAPRSWAGAVAGIRPRLAR